LLIDVLLHYDLPLIVSQLQISHLLVLIEFSVSIFFQIIFNIKDQPVKFNALNHIHSLKKYFATHHSKHVILTQNTDKSERKLKLRWILVASSLPLFGIYTAFGIAPQTVVHPVTQATLVESIDLPSTQIDSTQNKKAVFWYKEYVRRDDTLNTILTRLNISNRDAVQFVHEHLLSDETSELLIPGHAFEASVDNEGNLITLEYQYDHHELMRISATPEHTFTAEKMVRQLDKRPILKSAVITNSLFSATDKANIPDEIATKIVSIFESEIDFHQDLRRDDYFNVIYEAKFEDGAYIETGEILAVEFMNKGKAHRAIGLRDESNKMQYYTPEGQSLHKSFLRSPLEFTRITSGFNLGRFHPILQTIRAHKGVDMAAPTGTGIKASGDAVVDFVGVKSGYGNVVVLKHNGGMSTVYGHLSRFASGLSRGDKVSQGQLIGYVGMTGLATGPHLHYEFLLNGQHRDPMSAALPKAEPIPASKKAEFNRLSQRFLAQLSLLNNTNIAALE